jgi:hypothetical protein
VADVTKKNERASTLRDQINEFHRELGNFYTDFASRFSAWCTSHLHELEPEALECLYNGPTNSAEGLQRLIQDHELERRVLSDKPDAPVPSIEAKPRRKSIEELEA